MDKAAQGEGFVEEIEVHGHIVDSLLLPKILDRILQMGGTFEIRQCTIGSRRVDPSHAKIAVRAQTAEALDEILGDLVEHGATPVHPGDVQLTSADVPGAFPDGFYCSTNQRTQVRLGGRWIDVDKQEMDCGVAVDPSGKRAGASRWRRFRLACRLSWVTRVFACNQSNAPERVRALGS